MHFKIKELHKLITTLKNEEGLSDYGTLLLEGYATGLQTVVKENCNLQNVSISCLSDGKKSMNEYLKSQIEEHCQMVQRGAKPLSLLPHQERYYDEIVEIIKDHKLHYSSELNGDGWRTIYIYKNKALRYLIAELPVRPEKPSEHALIGYLLGYDTDSICDHILGNCQLEEPNLM